MKLAFLALGLVPPALAQDCESVTTLEHVSTAGDPADGVAWEVDFSNDGSRLVFASQATNLVPGDTNGTSDVYFREIDPSSTLRLSVSDAGVQGNGWSYDPAISPDGTLAAFASQASNLVPGDVNGSNDVFVRDLAAGTIERISVSTLGVAGNDDSDQPVISADGRYVAFSSHASNLVTGDTNNARDVFVHDLQAGTTTIVSVDSSGAQGSADSWQPRIALSGQLVFFASKNDLSATVSPLTKQIYVHDRASGVTECVSLSNAGEPSRDITGFPSCSEDGRYVAFRTRANNLTSETSHWRRKVYVRDRVTNRTTLESRSLDAIASQHVYDPDLSADGSTLTFSTFSNLLPAGVPHSSLYARSRDLGHVCNFALSATGEPATGSGASMSLNADGSSVAYTSSATNLSTVDTPGSDVFVSTFRFGVGQVICGGDGRFGDCPCTNPGTRGEGCENSTRMGARLDLAGTARLDEDDLAFHASNLPEYEPVLLFAGAPGSVQAFGDGLRCVNGPVTRIGVADSGNHGEATWGDGMLSAADAEFTIPVAFQAWYRDPAGPCGGGSNLTQAVLVLPAH